MGYYKKEGVHDEKPYYQQLDTQGKGRYLYYMKGTNRYTIGATLGGGGRGMRCLDESGHIVPHSWEYFSNGPNGDIYIRLDPVNKVKNCNKVTIELCEDAAEYQNDVAGDYVPIDKFSAGRVVFQHSCKQLYLNVWPVNTGWSVREAFKKYLQKTGSFSICFLQLTKMHLKPF